MREYMQHQLMSICVAPSEMHLMCGKDARGLRCGHLCSSKRRHFEVPVGRGYFKAEGIDIELCCQCIGWGKC